ncbi:MAG: hypothetical protein ACK40K_05220 [Raineya sp.]
MKQIFFRTLIATALVSSAAIGVFIILVLIFYKNPLNSVPKGFDWLFFIGMPVWAMLYYKLKVNNRTLVFQEGLVMGALVSFAMMLTFASTIAVACTINENILNNYIKDWVADLTNNQELWKKRLQTTQEYEKLLNAYKNLTLGQYLFKELAGKMVLLLLVSIVGATAFRGEPKAINEQKSKKKKV